jgi:predicted transcriptional regulator
MSKPEADGSIPELLFDLANADRFALLNQISNARRRMSELSKVIGATQPECSRHLARLTKAGLVMRGGDGFYEITPVGRTILRLVPGIGVTVEHKGYFLSHDLSFLPSGFVERIGALARGEYVDHVSLVIEHIKKVVSEANDHVWMISDRLFPQWPGIGETFASGDIAVRLVGAQDLEPQVVSDYKSRLVRCEIGTLKEVKVAMVISESTAGVLFPNLRGVIDWGAGFAGNDPAFLGWCADLFQHYWSMSSKTYAPSPFK